MSLCGRNVELFLGVKTVCACNTGLTRSLHMELEFTLSVRKHAVPRPYESISLNVPYRLEVYGFRQAYYRVRWRTPDIAHKFL